MMTQAEVLTDTLQGVAGAVTTGNFQESDVWFYIAMVEFVIIFFLLLFAFRRRNDKSGKARTSGRV